jgi:hypothetical protein
VSLQNFSDGTVPGGQNGPLNDRSYLSALVAFANLRTDRLMASPAGDQPSVQAAAARAHPGETVKNIALDVSFTAFDQRTEDRSKSFDFFLFKFQGGAARDLSLSALHLTGSILVDGIAKPGGGFRFKAVLQNQGSRASISVFSGDADVGAAFAKSSFQAVGDLEELLVDLAVLTTAQRMYDIDPSVCLNAPMGADYAATTEEVYARMSPREIEDNVTASLFQLGYLAQPVMGFPVEVSRALRTFQARHNLPPDGAPNAPTFLSLGRAVQGRESGPIGTSVTDVQLGHALERGQTGNAVSWSQAGLTGVVTITQTFENYQSLRRPCRAFQHIVTADGRRLMQPERIACRLAPDVWATLH